MKRLFPPREPHWGNKLLLSVGCMPTEMPTWSTEDEVKVIFEGSFSHNVMSYFSFVVSPSYFLFLFLCTFILISSLMFLDWVGKWVGQSLRWFSFGLFVLYYSDVLAFDIYFIYVYIIKCINRMSSFYIIWIIFFYVHSHLSTLALLQLTWHN